MDAGADTPHASLSRLARWRARVGAWDIRVDEELTAAGQMARDEALARAGRPTLRLFRWPAPAFSTGYRQRPPSWLDAATLAARGLELVERPTGGGIAVHGTDLSCSVTAPRFAAGPLEALMERIGFSVAQACRAYGAEVRWQMEVASRGPIVYCLAQRSPYAVMAGARKLCGFAVRAYEASWLVQGSLLARPMSALHRAVMPEEVRASFSREAVSLEESAGAPVASERLIDRFIEAWDEAWQLPCHRRDEELAYGAKQPTKKGPA